MRTKKALKQLSKAEVLIGAVADRYTPKEPRLQELLDFAKATISRAKGVLDRRSGQPSRTSPQTTDKQTQLRESENAAVPEFAGSKADFVRAVVEARGPAGVTARDIDAAFTARRIDRSKNLIYNALSALVKQKKLKKQGDRYFSASPNTNSKPAPRKKRISPEGIKRIIAANKKRWAERKATHAAAARRTSPIGNKPAVPRKTTGKRASAKRARR